MSPPKPRKTRALAHAGQPILPSSGGFEAAPPACYPTLERMLVASPQEQTSVNISDLILVTGGAGFIGSNFILQWIATESSQVVNLDLLTYAGNLANLSSLESNSRYSFVHGDICDKRLLAEMFRRHRPRAIVHFAAESHVDRSILGPEEFVRT